MKTKSDSKNSCEHIYTRKPYSLRVTPLFFEAIEKHIAGKSLSVKYTTTKSKWLREAIEEALDEPLDTIPAVEEEQMRVIQIHLPEDTQKRLYEKVKELKEVHNSFSIKKFLTLAAERKMNLERQEIELALRGLLESMSS